MFEKLPDQMEIDMAELPHIDILPPRRTLIDFLPSKLKGWLRDRYHRPTYTKREMWCVHSWLLRVMANRLLVAASEQADRKQEYLQHMGRDYEPGKGGWN